MRILPIAFLAISLSVLGCATTSQTVIEEAPMSSSRHVSRGVFPFQGEVMTFDARHVATKASIADAIIQVGYESTMEDGTRYIPIIGTAASKSIIRLFARIDDRAEAYIDPDTWETIYSFKHMDENNRERSYNVWFWNDDQIASVERTQKERTVKRDFILPEGTMDSIVWVFHTRARQLEVGKSYINYSFDGWTLNRIELKVVAKEDVWTPDGFVEAQKYEIWRERSEAQAPRGALSGVYIEPERKVQVESYLLATAWLATDEMKTPIRMVISTALGDFDLMLKSIGKVEP